MSNVLAIAGKELKSYFATPIAFVILTFFTLIYGWFFTAILFFVNQQSARFGAAGFQSTMYEFATSLGSVMSSCRIEVTAGVGRCSVNVTAPVDTSLFDCACQTNPCGATR